MSSRAAASRRRNRVSMHALGTKGVPGRYTHVAVLECTHAVLARADDAKDHVGHLCAACAQDPVETPTAVPPEGEMRVGRGNSHPPEVRGRVVYLYDMGMQYGEIAALLNLPSATVGGICKAAVRDYPQRPKGVDALTELFRQRDELVHAQKHVHGKTVLAPLRKGAPRLPPAPRDVDVQTALESLGESMRTIAGAVAGIANGQETLTRRLETLEDVVTRPPGENSGNALGNLDAPPAEKAVVAPIPEDAPEPARGE